MKTILKKTLLILAIMLFSSVAATAQDFGISLSGSTAPSFSMDGFIKKNQESYHLGFSYQFSDRKGKTVDKQLPNYGRTVDRNGQFFWTLDFGYGYWFKNQLAIFGELSAGQIVEYTNYKDGRFNGGGYNMIESREITAGIGAFAGYELSRNIMIFAGYHNLKETTFGLRITN